jgi:DNA-binding MarR family transcriptional regulator
MTPVQHHVLPLLTHLARVGAKAADEALAPTGLRPRHLIALVLLDNRGPATQQQLTELLSLDPSNVVGLLNDLEELELVTRRRDPADRRRHIVEISAPGRDRIQLAQSRLGDAEDHLLGALTPAERITLHDLLARAAGADRALYPDLPTIPTGGIPT